jgi:hypothetical protein
MRRQQTTRLTLLLAFLAGLLVLAGLRAEPPAKETDKTEPEPPKKTPAAKLRPLTNGELSGFRFLATQQQPNGGFGAGDGVVGAFPVAPFGPAMKPVPPPKGVPVDGTVKTDVANTSIAALAMLRAGYSPKRGTYSDRLQKALGYVCSHVEASDKDGLSVTHVTGTQVQRKIGTNVDTFMAALVLAEAKGKMPDARSEKRVEAALEKVIAKIETNQKKDGTWAGEAWAPVLSQAVASKALNRARQVGMKVDPAVLEKTADHARTVFDSGDGKGGPDLTGAAGVTLYATAASVGALHDSLATERALAERARSVLTSPNASDDDKKEAKEQLARTDKMEKSLVDVAKTVAKQTAQPQFLKGFGSDGGEEFLSFVLIGETLRAQDPKEWASWDKTVATRLGKDHNADGSWSGMHCITGKTFCTAAALMALMTDRAPQAVLDDDKPAK